MATGFEALARLIQRYQERGREASVLVASELLGDIKTRVFVDGKDTNENEIQNVKRKEPGTGYSKRPYFTNIDRLINKGRAPKPSVGGWIQLPEGYSSFRAFSGRQTDRVDLDYTSVLRQGFIFELNDEGFNLGFVGGEPSKSGGATVIEKAKFAEWRNGAPVFSPNEKEIESALQTFFQYVQP